MTNKIIEVAIGIIAFVLIFAFLLPQQTQEHSSHSFKNVIINTMENPNKEMIDKIENYIMVAIVRSKV